MKKLRCILCGKERTWKTKWKITFDCYISRTFTICPECRKQDSIEQLFSVLYDTFMEEMKKNYKLKKSDF